MKQPVKPIQFSTDKPILSGSIYLIQQGDVKKVVSKGSLEKMNLSGEWKVINEFKNEIQ
jgi:hypothetical protein